MTDAAIIKILKRKGIYITNSRVMVFRIIYEYKGTFDAAQILKTPLAKLDRITVYRTLQIFLKHQLIMTVPKAKGWSKYLLREITETENSKLYRVAVYFICTKCGTVKKIPILKAIGELVPQGHKVHSSEIIIEGKCNKCADIG